MIEHYVLTTSLVEEHPIEESHQIFISFRTELISRASQEKYDRIVDAIAYRDTSSATAEVEVRLTVTPPLSEAIQQASDLLREAASAAGIRVVDGDENSSTGDMVYADEGSHLVAYH